MKNDCIFCNKIQNENVAYLGGDVVYFKPLEPVTKGHLLVVPIKHVKDFTENPDLTAETMKQASILAGKMKNVNVIISKGKWATQTIKHLHIHIVPRRKRDMLPLPWMCKHPTGYSKDGYDVCDFCGAIVGGNGLLDKPGTVLSPVSHSQPPETPKGGKGEV